jgi:hypothetical protein
MSDLKRIEKRIRELAGRRRNVKFSEIEWVVNQLRLNGYDTGSRTNGHQTLFRVGNRNFGVCSHNPGSKQVKACYVDEFLDATIDIGLYDE